MTSQFDNLLEKLMSELTVVNEAPITGDISDIAPKIVAKAKEAPMSGHWKLLKKQENMEQVVMDILKHVLPEKNNTYNPDIDTPEELKAAIKDAIEEVTSKKGWAAKFLADRLANKELIGSVTYDIANKAMASQKPVTQKEVKQALNKALETKTPSPEQDSSVMYYKAADLDSDDAALTKAFNKIPSDKNVSWEEIKKMVGEESANALKKVGAIIEVVGAEAEEDEEKEIPALEFNDEDDLDISSDFDRVIDPYFSTTKGDYFRD